MQISVFPDVCCELPETNSDFVGLIFCCIEWTDVECAAYHLFACSVFKSEDLSSGVTEFQHAANDWEFVRFCLYSLKSSTDTEIPEKYSATSYCNVLIGVNECNVTVQVL